MWYVCVREREKVCTGALNDYIIIYHATNILTPHKTNTQQLRMIIPPVVPLALQWPTRVAVYIHEIIHLDLHSLVIFLPDITNVLVYALRYIHTAREKQLALDNSLHRHVIGE